LNIGRDKDVSTPAPEAGGIRRDSEGGQGPALVAFDFDGTLTVKDSFNAFLLWRTPWTRLLLGLFRLSPALAAYVLRRDRGRIKADAVRVLLGGVSRERLAADAEAFAEAFAQRLFRPDALMRWEAHGREGDTRVIITASPEDVIAPFARRLGADRLIGTRLRFDARDRVAGGFEGPNCRGPEKVVRLEAVYGADVRLAAAYGDTSGDIEMLARADRPFMRLFQGRPER
jgi:phosphatidylglycerophosphatase C